MIQLQLFIGLTLALVWSVLGQEIPKVLSLGSPLPGFSLKATNGKTYSRRTSEMRRCFVLFSPVTIALIQWLLQLGWRKSIKTTKGKVLRWWR